MWTRGGTEWRKELERFSSQHICWSSVLLMGEGDAMIPAGLSLPPFPLFHHQSLHCKIHEVSLQTSSSFLLLCHLPGPLLLELVDDLPLLLELAPILACDSICWTRRAALTVFTAAVMNLFLVSPSSNSWVNLTVSLSISSTLISSLSIISSS